MLTIPAKLVQFTKNKLGHDKIVFYRMLKEKYGTIDASWQDENNSLHIVSNCEGKEVKDFMFKQIPNFPEMKNWKRKDVEENWINLIEKVLKN